MHTDDGPFVDAAPRSEFRWPGNEPAGHIAGLESWPRPLKGVRIDGDYLCFEYRRPLIRSRGPLELATADLNMLVDFANLADGDPVADGRLIKFASHYGALGLCKEHGWPFAHI